LASLTPEDDVRAAASVRLHTLLTKLNAQAPDLAQSESVEQLTDASADDLFDFIDHQLGRGVG
jgi:hypothetical protein